MASRKQLAIIALHLYKERQCLADNLTLNDSIVQSLDERGVLLETDVAYLDNVKSLGSEIWAKELLRLVAFRNDGIRSLLELLSELGEYRSVHILKYGLDDEFENRREKPPAFVAFLGPKLQAGRAKTSVRRACKVLKSWGIPFGDCLRIEEDEDQENLLGWIDQQGETYLPSYTPQPTPVPGTKAHYFYGSSVLGRGYTSTVFSGYWDNDPNIKVAVKYVHKIANAIISTREIELAKQIWSDRTPTSAHVVAVLDWSRIGNAYYIIMEQAWGTLDHAVEINLLNLREDHPKMLRLLHNCAHGLQWVHQNCVAHGDVNPTNVLIFEYPNSELCAKLSDFGYCRSSHQSCSSIIFQSPEVLTRLSCEPDPAGDIFSLGLLFHYTLSGGQHPFRGESLHVLSNPSPRLLNIKVHWRVPAAQNIILCMLHQIPEHRPTIAQVILHPIFWEEEKCLGFLENVSRALSNKSYSDQCKNIRQSINELYCQEHPNFAWIGLVEMGFFERQGKSGRKNYNSSSVLSLVELIRDKAEHYQDMVESLREILFKEEQQPFNRKAYAEYFMIRFPQIVIFLFSWISGHARDFECLGALREQYLEGI